MNSCDARGALTEFRQAIELDPTLDLAFNALGLTYHLSFGDFDSAITNYKKAIDLNPKLSEAYTNLANVYLDQGRYDDAIPLYEKALSDILYKTPYIAENNLGWCYFKKGQVQTGIDHIRSALVSNARFCLGHRNLGLIYAESGDPQKSADSFSLYVRHCPDLADAHFRYGTALLKLQDTEGARRELQTCVAKGNETHADNNGGAQEQQVQSCRRAQELSLIDECQKYLRLLEQQ
jgi:tetratricopeptide (TPR) repeat protein